MSRDSATLKDPTPELTALLRDDPDLVDRIFEYVLAEVPEFAERLARKENERRLLELKVAVRQEFGGDRQSIGSRSPAGQRDLRDLVGRLFNGRNATEVGRRLRIGRTTVYRVLRRAGD